MMRTWTLHGLVALLSLAVVVPALRAAPPTDNPTDDKATEILIQQIKKIRLQLDAIQTTQDVQLKSMQDDIDRLKDDLRRLSDEVRRLSAAPPNIAASINPAAPASPLVTSNILLENRYSSPATVYINGTPYRLNPFERRTVPEPVGRFSYAVYTDDYGLIQGLTDRYLSPSRDFPITINP